MAARKILWKLKTTSSEESKELKSLMESRFANIQPKQHHIDRFIFCIHKYEWDIFPACIYKDLKSKTGFSVAYKGKEDFPS